MEQDRINFMHILFPLREINSHIHLSHTLHLYIFIYFILFIYSFINVLCIDTSIVHNLISSSSSSILYICICIRTITAVLFPSHCKLYNALCSCSLLQWPGIDLCVAVTSSQSLMPFPTQLIWQIFELWYEQCFYIVNLT